MIECIFTLDYEIFGSGKGTLAEFVLEPAERLRDLFRRADQRFVLFPDVAELELISTTETDPDIGNVRQQIQSLYDQGFEVGLHLHPWWYNARRRGNEWMLDYSEYNLCTLPTARIAHLIDRGLQFLRDTIENPDFTPLSYRAGHLLLQPAGEVVKVLASRGIRLDSSVYKGGVWQQHNLDYRPSLKHGYFWRFDIDPNLEDANGRMLEIPIHTEMVPTWRMLTGKRVSLERRSARVSRTPRRVIDRLRDLRLRRATKFDYCVLSFDEMKSMIDSVRRLDNEDPTVFRPLVAIGHTKDLVDLSTVERVIEYLANMCIPVSNFRGVCGQCGVEPRTEAVRS
jgi:hypothetical protein